MATIRENGPGQWCVQVRRSRWPIGTRTWRTHFAISSNIRQLKLHTVPWDTSEVSAVT